MESNAKPRDYDQDPIVIEDYNPMLHMPVIFLVGAFFLYFEITLHKSGHTMGFWALTFFPALFFYFTLRKAKRNVVLKEEILVYRENIEALESIHINEITSIERTFSDFYRKKQKMNSDWTIRIWISRVIAPIENILLILTKVMFHFVKNRLSSYKLFDAILITTQDERIINILPTNNVEYEIVRGYFLQKCGVDIITVKTTVKFDYMDEEISKKL